MLEIITDMDALSRIKGKWDGIILSNKRARVFQTFEWNWAALNLLHERGEVCEPWIAYWHDSNGDVILPTYIDGFGTLRFINDSGCDVCDAIYNDSVNNHLAFLAIVRQMKGERKIKRVWLQKMAGTSEALNYFGVFLRGAFVARDNAFSWLKVPPSEDFISSLHHMKSKDRADLKCLRRQAERYNLRILSANNEDPFPAVELRTLRDHMRNSGKRAKGYFPECDIEFVRALYNCNLCSVAVLDMDGVAQAINVLLTYKDRILSWVFFYSDPRTSTALYIKYLCEAKKDSTFIFDFGVGVYSYKIGTFRPCTELTFALHYGKSLLQNTIGLLRINIRFVKDFVKSVVSK